MVSGHELRSIALSLPHVAEKPHFQRTSFRVDVSGGMIFVTMPADQLTANVMLDRVQQDIVCSSEPDVFSPVKGKWGENGATVMQLKNADTSTLRSVITMAWKNAAPKKLSERLSLIIEIE